MIKKMTKIKHAFVFLILFFSAIFLSVSNAAVIKKLKVDPHQVLKVSTPSTCLSSTLSLINPTNWYAQGQLTITNNCSSPQALNNAVVSFQSNSNNLTAMWGGVNSSAPFTYTGNIASTVLIIQNDPLPIGQKLTLFFGINLVGTPFDLTSANNTLSVIPYSPTPSNGEIDVTVDPSGVVGVTTSSEIDITGPGLTQPYVILNSSWSAPTTFQVTGLAYGTYTITAKPIGTSYLGTATPSTVTLNSSTPAPVSVTYQPAPATGALQINLSAAPMQGLASS